MTGGFRGKKVGILGFGVEGQDASRYLLSEGAAVTVFDQRLAPDFGDAYTRYRKLIHFVFGRDYLKVLQEQKFDFLVRSPGFRPDLPEIRVALKKGARLTSSTKIFFNEYPGKIIGVTGTKGKGTTATLIHRILENDGRRVYLAGNIGQPLLKLLRQAEDNDWAVLELSSFQLIDLDQSPHVAVVLAIVPEHQDYHRSYAEYRQAKANLVRFQQEQDFCVLNYDNIVSRSFSDLTKARVSYFSRSQKNNGAYIDNRTIYYQADLIGKTDDIKLRGQHNWDNVCAAVAATRAAGVGLTAIRTAVFSFSGLEHRLEPVGTFRGVSYYNDSFSTTPETAIAAIRSFTEPLILIAGGSDKGSDYTELGKAIAVSTVKSLILIGQMADQIRRAVLQAGFSGRIVFQPRTMADVVRLAATEAREGDVVLFSPACASFDMFNNYKERGYQFKHHAKALKK